MNGQNPPDDNEELKSYISQDSNSSMDGGQQACIGNNNSQRQDNRTYVTQKTIYNFASPYLNLENTDFQKPLNIWGRVKDYVGVILFLFLTLISWFFYGLGSGFPFPYQQGVDLFLSCFNGEVVQKTNNFQKNFQSEHISSKSVRDLNQILVQADLYLGVLEKLIPNGGESDDRVAKTIEALKDKKTRIQVKLEPIQEKQYQEVIRSLDRFSISRISKLFRGEVEIYKIERVLEEITGRIKCNETPQSLYQDTLRWLLEESLNIQKITPYRLGIIYRIQNLIVELEKKELKKLPSPILRYLDGEYIGNTSNPESKFHSQKKCQHWRALAFEYMLYDELNREIISSSDDLPFVSRGMQPCEFCDPDVVGTYPKDHIN